MLTAVIFDFDGVLVDSEPLHYQAFAALFEPMGLELDYETYMRELIGFDDRDAIHWIAQQLSMADVDIEQLCQRKQDVFDDLARGIAPLPGALDLVDACIEAGLAIAVASGATRRDIELMLGGLGRSDVFPVIVSADDVARSKPDPTTYSQAVDQLARHHNDPRITPKTAVAIEDTPTGIHSARTAGLAVLGVTTTVPKAMLKQADCVVDSLMAVSPRTLGQLIE